MRSLIVVAVLAGVAAASPIDDAIRARDPKALGWEVMFAEGADRERILDALIAIGRLDARTRSAFPTPQAITRELAKLGTAKTKTRKPLAAESCSFETGRGGDIVFQCSERACPGACQVTRNEATIRVRAGRWTVTVTTVKHLGDTGACGCCMHLM
jgi:hypothetical protein